MLLLILAAAVVAGAFSKVVAVLAAVTLASKVVAE
jgi:hypothetical protein